MKLLAVGRRIRFSLRSLCLMMLVCGAAAGWVLLQRQTVEQRKFQRQKLEADGALFVPDFNWDRLSLYNSRNRILRRMLSQIESEQSGHPPLPWLRRQLHDDYIEGICLPEGLASRCDEAARWFPEATIISDDGRGYADAQREQRMRLTLSQSTEFSFDHVPLIDALDYLHDLHDIDFSLDQQTFNSGAADLQMPVTCSAKNMRLSEGLDRLLAPLHSTYWLRHQELVIGSESGRHEAMKSLPGVIRLKK